MNSCANPDSVPVRRTALGPALAEALAELLRWGGYDACTLQEGRL